MIGTAHYRRAETLMAQADELPVTLASLALTRAQVHATLALAAVTAQAHLGIKDGGAWIDALTGGEEA